jgi:hypothetical protein
LFCLSILNKNLTYVGRPRFFILQKCCNSIVGSLWAAVDLVERNSWKSQNFNISLGKK